jgi:ketosteroid isomerase-like protein
MNAPIVDTSARERDVAACTRLCVDFANHIDARRYDDVLDLFAEDGILDRMGQELVGREAIAGFLAARPQDVETRHLCTNISVEIHDANEGVGSSYVLFVRGKPQDGPSRIEGPPSVVEYHDRFTRTAAGWRIRSRRIRIVMSP